MASDGFYLTCLFFYQVIEHRLSYILLYNIQLTIITVRHVWDENRPFCVTSFSDVTCLNKNFNLKWNLSWTHSADAASLIIPNPALFLSGYCLVFGNFSHPQIKVTTQLVNSNFEISVNKKWNLIFLQNGQFDVAKNDDGRGVSECWLKGSEIGSQK